jgi:hypothetical protein
MKRPPVAHGRRRPLVDFESRLRMLCRVCRICPSEAMLTQRSAPLVVSVRLDRRESSSARRSMSASTETWGSPDENPAQTTASVIHAGIAQRAPSGNSQWRYSPSGRETRRSHSRETPWRATQR